MSGFGVGLSWGSVYLQTKPFLLLPLLQGFTQPMQAAKGVSKIERRLGIVRLGGEHLAQEQLRRGEFPSLAQGDAEIDGMGGNCGFSRDRDAQQADRLIEVAHFAKHAA